MIQDKDITSPPISLLSPSDLPPISLPSLTSGYWYRPTILTIVSAILPHYNLFQFRICSQPLATTIFPKPLQFYKLNNTTWIQQLGYNNLENFSCLNNNYSYNIMEDSQDPVDTSLATSLATIMEQLATMQQQMDSLKKTTSANGNKCSSDLEAIRTDLAVAEEARKMDHNKLEKLGKDLNKVNSNLDTTNSTFADQDHRITLVDNTSNKNKERLTRLEERIAQMENGARPKVPTTTTVATTSATTIVQTTIPTTTTTTTGPAAIAPATTGLKQLAPPPAEPAKASYASKAKAKPSSMVKTTKGTYGSWDIHCPRPTAEAQPLQQELSTGTK